AGPARGGGAGGAPPAGAGPERRPSVGRAEGGLLPQRRGVVERPPPADARAELRVGVLSCECCDQRLRREAELLLTRPLAERLAVLRQRVSERALRRKGCGERLCRELLSILDGQRSERALERVLGSELLGDRARLAIVRGGVEHHVSCLLDSRCPRSVVARSHVAGPGEPDAAVFRPLPIGAAEARQTQRACHARSERDDVGAEWGK